MALFTSSFECVYHLNCEIPGLVPSFGTHTDSLLVMNYKKDDDIIFFLYLMTINTVLCRLIRFKLSTTKDFVNSRRQSVIVDRYFFVDIDDNVMSAAKGNYHSNNSRSIIRLYYICWSLAYKVYRVFCKAGPRILFFESDFVRFQFQRFY